MKKRPDFAELRDKLSPQVGPPTYTGTNKKRPTLNQQFFARLAQEVFNPIFEKIEETFFVYSPGTGLWEPQDSPTMLARISELMMRYANETGDAFINSKRDVGTIHNILNFMKADSCCGRENAFARNILNFMKADSCCGRENAFARKGETFIHCGNGMILFPPQPDGRRPAT